MDDSDSKPFTIHSDTRITLGPLAKEMARTHGMSLDELGKHLLQQERLRRAGLTQRDGES